MNTSRSESSVPHSSVPKNSANLDSDYETELPPLICCNPREKIKGEEIPISDLFEDKEDRQHRDETAVLVTAAHIPPPQPYPRYSLTLGWAPPCLRIDLDDETVIKQLVVQNSGTHSIYIQCCGLWDSTARLGASWKSYPRTRFLLAPGLTALFAVRASPREYPSPLPSAYVAMQLAASNLRDNVTGYFMVPIHVNFKNYVPPAEHGSE